MKQLLLSLFLAFFAFVSCRNTTDRPAGKDDNGLQNGDLIFVGIPMNYTLSDSASTDQTLADATDDSSSTNYIHVAIVEVDGDSTFVIDATIKRGVARYPIDTFFADFKLKDGSYPRFDVMRLKDNANSDVFIANAKRYVGRGYDMWFLADNEEQYCSELVRNAYISRDGSFVFGEAPMNFKKADGEFPTYWVELFGLLGMPIPQDVMGTIPNAMLRDTNLRYVTTIERK